MHLSFQRLIFVTETQNIFLLALNGQKYILKETRLTTSQYSPALNIVSNTRKLISNLNFTKHLPTKTSNSVAKSFWDKSNIFSPFRPSTPWGWFNKNIPSYQYRKSHCGDKTVVRSSYLHNGISYTGKMSSLYWIGALLFWINFVENPCTRRMTRRIFLHWNLSVTTTSIIRFTTCD